MPGFTGKGLPLKITGTVYQPDGKTPAPNVILYFYQTDHQGIYSPVKGATGWARKHGAIREWLKQVQMDSIRCIPENPVPTPVARSPRIFT